MYILSLDKFQPRLRLARRLHEATCTRIKGGLALWACFRSSGDYEKAKERRSFGERIFTLGEGGASLRPWTFILLDSCGLWVTCGAKRGSKRAKRGVFRT